MSDLISRQEAIDELAKEMPRLTTPDGCGPFDREIQIADEAFVDCMTIINELPSADAVPVVRCGECKHMTADGRCLEFADDCLRPSASDFCSKGERRIDGTAD